MCACSLACLTAFLEGHKRRSHAFPAPGVYGHRWPPPALVCLREVVMACCFQPSLICSSSGKHAGEGEGRLLGMCSIWSSFSSWASAGSTRMPLCVWSLFFFSLAAEAGRSVSPWHCVGGNWSSEIRWLGVVRALWYGLPLYSVPLRTRCVSAHITDNLVSWCFQQRFCKCQPCQELTSPLPVLADAFVNKRFSKDEIFKVHLQISPSYLLQLSFRTCRNYRLLCAYSHSYKNIFVLSSLFLCSCIPVQIYNPTLQFYLKWDRFHFKLRSSQGLFTFIIIIIITAVLFIMYLNKK